MDSNRRNEETDRGQIEWYPIRRKWSDQSHVLERSIFMIFHVIISTVFFVLMTSLLMFLKVIPIESAQRYFLQRNCCIIVSIDSEEDDGYEMETEKEHTKEPMVDLR